MEDLIKKSANAIVKHKRASATFLFGTIKISYQDALKVLNELESIGILGPHTNNKDREILIESIEELNSILIKIYPNSNKKPKNELEENVSEETNILNSKGDENSKTNEIRFCEFCGTKQEFGNKTCINCSKIFGVDKDVTLKRVRHDNAILTLGILSVVGIIFFLPGFVLGIIALSMSTKSRREYNNKPDLFMKSSYNKLNAGYICALIATIITSIILFFFFVGISNSI